MKNNKKQFLKAIYFLIKLYEIDIYNYLNIK